MQNLENLKQELIKQKAEIEGLGGNVNVSQLNPSPSEITAGIKTIVGVDLSITTATAGDVVSGKTFYSKNKEIKTGTYVTPDLSLANANSEDVLDGKTFYAKDNDIRTGSLKMPKLESASASANDVVSGKTFFAGDKNLKTGTLVMPKLKEASAVSDDVLEGKTFFSGTSEMKTGSLKIPDMKQADAETQHVLAGKKFYAGNTKLKTGTLTVPAVEEANAKADEVLEGKTFFAGDKEIKTGTLTVPAVEEADAKTEDVVAGKKFFAGDKEIKTGTLTVPAVEEADAKAEEVLEGKTFFAGSKQKQTGTLTVPDFTLADAVETDVMSGKKFYAGDKTIKTGSYTPLDLSTATATESDVKKDVTFFAGDNSIKTGTYEPLDTTLATATENDVLAGKTFFAGSDTLKTGILELSSGSSEKEEMYYNLLFYYKNDPQITYDVYWPERLTSIREYIFYLCPHYLNFYNPPTITEIKDSAFYGAYAKIMSYENLLNLEKIGPYALGGVEGIDVSNLPPKIKNYPVRCFCNTAPYSPSKTLVVPSDPTITFGDDVFLCYKATPMENLIFPSEIKGGALPKGFLQNLQFNCDFVCPENVTVINQQFNYCGNFKNITIGCKVTSIGAFAFSGLGGVGYNDCDSITFLGQTPPSIVISSLPRERTQYGLMIYVPDESLEEYKTALNKTAPFNVAPISQKP